ncbi:MAG: cupin domain-containing protein [Planctomycetota bacterium]
MSEAPDLERLERPPLTGDHSKVIPSRGPGEWEGVGLEPYKQDTETWRGITRRELLGKRGEASRFHVRYFEIQPGGYSTLERHQHIHVVIPLRGRGEAQLGCRIYRVGPHDVIYVSPDDPHQLRCPADAEEPFGFLCLVDAERDTPRPIEDRLVEGLGFCQICE